MIGYDSDDSKGIRSLKIRVPGSITISAKFSEISKYELIVSTRLTRGARPALGQVFRARRGYSALLTDC